MYVPGGSVRLPGLRGARSSAHRYPETRLAKLFNGQVPIVLDTLKQHYFIDRDGKMFRHILNYMRSGKVCVPDDFAELDCLMEEARFFEVQGECPRISPVPRETPTGKLAVRCMFGTCLEFSFENSSTKNTTVLGPVLHLFSDFFISCL